MASNPIDEILNKGNASLVDSGIEIEWQFNNRHVQLFVATSELEKSYIFYAETENKQVIFKKLIENPIVSDISDCLCWMQDKY